MSDISDRTSFQLFSCLSSLVSLEQLSEKNCQPRSVRARRPERRPREKQRSEEHNKGAGPEIATAQSDI
jgi:hypothetical protein